MTDYVHGGNYSPPPEKPKPSSGFSPQVTPGFEHVDAGNGNVFDQFAHKFHTTKTVVIWVAAVAGAVLLAMVFALAGHQASSSGPAGQLIGQTASDGTTISHATCGSGVPDTDSYGDHITDYTCQAEFSPVNSWYTVNLQVWPDGADYWTTTGLPTPGS